MSETPVRIVHITDTHVPADPGSKVYGIDPTEALRTLLAAIADARATPNLFIATGDLSADGSISSYRQLRTLLTQLVVPVYCIPGNHDSYTSMHVHLCDKNIKIERLVVVAKWQIIFLNTQIIGQDHGFLAKPELEALRGILEVDTETHALVCLHHGPLRVCSRTACCLENADELLTVLSQHQNVRAVIAGHNHCEAERNIGGIRVMITPSTFVQLSHQTDEHTLDSTHRGFRRLDLHPDGRIKSEVIWVPRSI